MVYGYQHRMGNCNICPLAPTVGTDPLKLCMEKRFFAVCRRVGACDKCGAQEPVPFPGFAGPAFACAFVAAGTESCPGSNIGICRESSHVRANDRDDDPGVKPLSALDNTTFFYYTKKVSRNRFAGFRTGGHIYTGVSLLKVQICFQAIPKVVNRGRHPLRKTAFTP